MENVNGKDIVCCFNTVNQIWREIELMTDRLVALLSKRLSDSSLHVEDKENPEYAIFGDNYSDVRIGLIKRLGIKSSKKKKNPDFYIGFQVSLAETLISIPDNEEPILYMISCPAKFSFEERVWHVDFPISEDDDDTDFSIENDIVMRWNDKKIVYGVKLLALSNEYDLLKLCVEPAVSLYAGKNAEQVFGNDPDQRFVRFPPKDKLIIPN